LIVGVIGAGLLGTACATLVLAVFNTEQVEAVVEGGGGMAEAADRSARRGTPGKRRSDRRTRAGNPDRAQPVQRGTDTASLQRCCIAQDANDGQIEFPITQELAADAQTKSRYLGV
jgi:hypothetical protein